MDDHYRQCFDAMPCYLTVQDREFRIIDANRQFRTDFGETEGRFCYQVYKRRSEKCEVCPVEQSFRDGHNHRSEERVKCLDGREVDVLVEATPVRNEQGEITSVIEMSTDVTHIMELETQLRRSQRRYRLLFDEVPCYISIQDPDLHIVEANRAFQEGFGSCLGCKCFEVYKHRTEPCVPCPVQDTFDDGEPHTREEVVTALDGTTRNVLVTAAPIRNRHGEITHVMEMSADITQVRELEERLTSLGLLIGSVSHGLRGLLNGLAGGMYLVDSGLAKDDAGRIRKGWATVHRNVDRIRSMVSDILYYAKDRVPTWEPLQAVAAARDVCEAVAPRATEYGVTITTDLDASAGEFEADPQALRALLTNLVDNSLDACRRDTKKTEHRVAARLRGDAESIEYVIEDNGVGMDRETRERAFSLFFTSKGMEGTGLGLFIANRIAQAHGGSIRLESEPGVGTQFIVRLPRHRAQNVHPGPTTRAATAKDDTHA